MKKHYFSSFLLSLALLFPAAPAMAGIPVTDIPKLIKDCIHQILQIKQWVDEINKWKQQAQNMEKQFKSTVGNRNVGAILNTVTDKNLRKYMPKDWDEAIGAIDEANKATRQLDAEVKAVMAELDHMKASNMYSDPTTQRAQDYERRRKGILASMAMAKGIFDRGKVQISNIELLMDQIDNGGNDQKAAIDLASRVSAESALLTAQSLQVQSTMSKQLAESNNYWNELDARNARNARHVTTTRYD